MLLVSNQSKEVDSQDQSEGPHKEAKTLRNVSMATVYEFLIKKRLVPDRSSATKLVASSLGGVGGLQNPGQMCYEEFNKLFCKGMFKLALINTLEQLQNQGAPAKQVQEGNEAEPDADAKGMAKSESQELLEDAKANFHKEMPLSLKIERY